MFQTTNMCTDNFCANQKYIKQHFLNTDLYVCNIIVFALNCSVQLVFKSSRSFHHRPETKVLFKQVEPLVFVCCVCVCSYTHLTSLLVNKPTLSNCSTAGILSSNRCCTISAISKRLWGKSSDKYVRYSEFYQNNEPLLALHPYTRGDGKLSCVLHPVVHQKKNSDGNSTLDWLIPLYFL